MTASHSAVEFEDVQALVRFAHGHLSEAAFLLLQVSSPSAARQWLQQASISRAVPASPLPDSALQVAFSAAGLQALGVSEAVLGEFSREFLDGMAGDANRSRRLGDTGANDPGQWAWGGSETPAPHILLMFYAPQGQLEQQLQAQCGAAFDQAFHTLTTLRSTVSSAVEPFGFADGLSQPDVQWQATSAPASTSRDGYSNAMALGELLLGYPNEYGLYTSRPLLDPETNSNSACLPAADDDQRCRDLGRNGTYLVLRQLAQDVPAFWRYIDQESASDPRQREALSAAMVGRSRDGKPLIDSSTDNDFTYADDPLGHRCPVGAHIRRANPRSGDFPPDVSGPVTRLLRTLGFCRQHPTDDLVASSRFHRLLRRGRVYGSPLAAEEALQDPLPANASEERGLFFICLGANISRQFEFVQNAWMASAKFAGLPTESDPLLGNREALLDGSPTDGFSMPRDGAPARHVDKLPQFVAVRGGGYFFLPGLRALEFILHAGEKPGGN